MRHDFIIEGTMRSFDVIAQTAQSVKQAGFRCEAHVLAVHRQDSLLGIFLRFERDKQRTGIGRFSPISVHDEAYHQIPLNLNKAFREKLVDRLVLYTRLPAGGLQVGFDQPGNQLEPVDFPAVFDRLRQPLFDGAFYCQQWLALSELAQSRNETDVAYLKHMAEFVRFFRQ